MDRVLIPWWPDGARALNIGRTKMYKLVKDGEVESVCIGRRRLVPASAITEYVERLRADQQEGAA